MRSKAVRIVADDGYQLAGTLYETAGGNHEVSLLINAAAGVSQPFYARYAKFMAEQGFVVLTYDYRGIGASRGANGSNVEPSLLDWGSRDLPAAVDWFTRERPRNGLVAVGHAFGGLAPGLAWNCDRIRGLLGVSAAAPDRRLWPVAQRVSLGVLSRLPLAMTRHLLARHPDITRELPASILEHQRRLLRTPDRIREEIESARSNHFHAYRGRLRSYCISDDRWRAPPRAVAALGRAYANGGLELVQVHPRDWDQPAIGHFGFFNGRAPRAVWQDGADWLLSAGRLPRLRLIEV